MKILPRTYTVVPQDRLLCARLGLECGKAREVLVCRDAG